MKALNINDKKAINKIAWYLNEYLKNKAKNDKNINETIETHQKQIKRIRKLIGVKKNELASLDRYNHELIIELKIINTSLSKSQSEPHEVMRGKILTISHEINIEILNKNIPFHIPLYERKKAISYYFLSTGYYENKPEEHSTIYNRNVHNATNVIESVEIEDEVERLNDYKFIVESITLVCRYKGN